MRVIALAIVIFVSALPTLAQVKTVEISPRVFALVGPFGQRSPGNLGNNATFGVVLTDDGAVLIDPGGTRQGAAALDRAIGRITDQPVVAVINTGGQDHRWLGNGYWAEKGARLIASTAAVADQKDRASIQLTVLNELVGPEFVTGTDPLHATETFETALDLEIGGTRFELRHVAAAHTPGDAFVWLPDDLTVFTGDIVYVGRMAAVLTDVSSSRGWLQAFEAVAQLQPQHVVPGHGPPTDLFTAENETYHYISDLREAIAAHIEAGGNIIGSVEVDQSAYSHLIDFDQLAKRNAQAVFQEMEWE